ncbi:MAG: AAA family ATPase, partial [Myxococcota bacterium]
MRLPMSPAPDDIIVPLSPVLRHVLEEARDIAEATGQPVLSSHVLLAFFVSRNPAERLLRTRNIDEDRLLGLADPEAKEPRVTLREIVARGSQMAAGCGATEVDCLHVLVAMTRHRESVAFRLLSKTEPKLSNLRTRALTILTGAVPRWMNRRSRSSNEERARPAMALSGRPRREERGRKPAISWTPPIVSPGAKKPSHSVPVRKPGALERRRSRSHSSVDHRLDPPYLPRPSERRDDRAERPDSRALRTEDRTAATDDRAGRPERSDRRSRDERAAPRSESPTHPMPDGGRPQKAAPIRRQPEPTPRAAPSRATSSDEGSLLSVPAPALPEIDAASPWVLDPQSYPWLTSLGRNLSAEAARGQFDPLVGRTEEVETLIDVLGKRRSNNPVLLGEPGVGKTAVVEGLANRLVQDDLHRLGQKIVVALDVGALLVGTHLRGSFSEKMQGVKEEVRRSRGRVVVFFDELHTLVGAGSTGEGPQDAANELKTVLARGHFPCIGATTYDEYKKHIEPDPALARRFVPIVIKELSPEQTVTTLERILPAYAEHHRVGYEADAIRSAVNLSARYITDRFLPDKAITLLDLAGSRAARRGDRNVTHALVAEIVAQRCGLPLERLLGSDRERLLRLSEYLEDAVVGQAHALTRIAAVVQRNAAGFRGHRPAGS